MSYNTFSGTLYFSNSLPRAINSEETSSGSNQYLSDKRDAAVIVEGVQPVEKSLYNENLTTKVPKEESPVDEQTNKLLDNLNIKVYFNSTEFVLCLSKPLVTDYMRVMVGSVSFFPF